MVAPTRAARGIAERSARLRDGLSINAWATVAAGRSMSLAVSRGDGRR